MTGWSELRMKKIQSRSSGLSIGMQTIATTTKRPLDTQPKV
jgi:hypothetical protein